MARSVDPVAATLLNVRTAGSTASTPGPRQGSSTSRTERFAVVLALAVLMLGATLTVAHAGSISYAYDAAGRLICVYDNNAGRGVNYNYDAVGNLLSITSSTGCTQNTMRDVATYRALASSRTVPSLTARRAHANSTLARAASRQRNLPTTAESKEKSAKKLLAVSLR